MPGDLHPNLALKQAYTNWIALHFKPGDYFVTLTFHPSAKPIPDLRSKDISHFIRKVETDLRKRGAIKKQQRLRTFSVFELNAVGECHAHLLLENPLTTRAEATKYQSELVEHWTTMRCSGLRAGQDVQLIENAEGYTVEDRVSYLTKDKSARKALYDDVANIWLGEGQRND